MLRSYMKFMFEYQYIYITNVDVSVLLSCIYC